jgi:hypothetical protein
MTKTYTFVRARFQREGEFTSRVCTFVTEDKSKSSIIKTIMSMIMNNNSGMIDEHEAEIDKNAITIEHTFDFVGLNNMDKKGFETCFYAQ